MSRIRLIAFLGLLAGLAAVAAILRRPVAPAIGMAPPGGSNHELLTGAAPLRRSSLSDRTRIKSRIPNQAPSSNDSLTALIGSVVAPVQATLSVRMAARIRRVFAREGESVRAGQRIIELDETEFVTQERSALAGELAAEAQVKRARAGLAAQAIKSASDAASSRGALRQAEVRLQQARLALDTAAAEQRADLRAAREAVNKARIADDRARNILKGLEELSTVGGVSRSDLDAARAQQRATRSDLESASDQVARLENGAGGVPFRVAAAQKDVDLAQAGVDQARDALATAEQAGRQIVMVAEQDVDAALAWRTQATAGLRGIQAARAQSRLASPITGLVTGVLARAGETAQPSTPLATVVSLAGLRVDALVPGRLLSLFRGGQSAHVSVDTAPGRVFDAMVSEIARIAEPDGRTFRVKFRLLGTPPLLPGQTARIKVFTSR